MAFRAACLPSTLLALTALAACAGFEEDFNTSQDALGLSGIVAVSASGHDGNPPENAIDGDLSTRWSSLGRGQWIQADLGETRTVDQVQIAWYRGNRRQSSFTISLSGDGSSFTQVYSGRSSGKTLSLETYTFSAATARFVKITVYGNTLNDWASITEIVVPFMVASGSGCLPLAIGSVTASAHDGNVPSNVLDGNLSTRWSCNGIGCWIQADLGSRQTVSQVSIAWYRGNERRNKFEIALSLDGQTLTRVFSGESSGTTTLPERYSFAAGAARFVRVIVNGNSANTWASITEMGVFAEGCPSNSPFDGSSDAGTTPAPAPAPEAAPGDGSTLPSEPAADGSTADRWGIPYIYPTKPGGETWFLADDATRDPRFDPQDPISRNSDGSWKMKSSQVRMHAKTSTGYDSSKIATYDRDVLASQGYMQAPNDWRNVEMTGFVKVNSASTSSENFSWYARGGRHNDSIPCEGSAYKGGLHYDGRVRWQKESWHVRYDQAPYASGTTSIIGRWVGFKAVMRNVTVSGATAVKLELYLNENADKVTWKKVYDMTDSGNWGGDASSCGGSSDAMPITWGGPLAMFRWDGADDVDFKWLSVREIQ